MPRCTAAGSGAPAGTWQPVQARAMAAPVMAKSGMTHTAAYDPPMSHLLSHKSLHAHYTYFMLRLPAVQLSAMQRAASPPLASASPAETWGPPDVCERKRASQRRVPTRDTQLVRRIRIASTHPSMHLSPELEFLHLAESSSHDRASESRAVGR